jgi:hypothetical protein
MKKQRTKIPPEHKFRRAPQARTSWGLSERASGAVMATEGSILILRTPSQKVRRLSEG